MPPTDSMEKPPTAECTVGPIAVFSNSYARLPERFSHGSIRRPYQSVSGGEKARIDGACSV